VRPAPLFGFEDRLLHKLAGVTNLFTANHMRERFWPVHVRTSHINRWLITDTRWHSKGDRCWPSPGSHVAG
jgi:hypothetical protein